MVKTRAYSLKLFHTESSISGGVDQGGVLFSRGDKHSTWGWQKESDDLPGSSITDGLVRKPASSCHCPEVSKPGHRHPMNPLFLAWLNSLDAAPHLHSQLEILWIGRTADLGFHRLVLSSCILIDPAYPVQWDFLFHFFIFIFSLPLSFPFVCDLYIYLPLFISPIRKAIGVPRIIASPSTLIHLNRKYDVKNIKLYSWKFLQIGNKKNSNGL